MKIQVDRALCGGLGICESIAPDYFKVGSEGTVVEFEGEVPLDAHAEVAEAASSCPNMVLRAVG